MTRLSVAKFREQLPEFQAADWRDPLVQRWIEVAESIYAINGLGIAYLTAHLLTIARDDGIIGTEVPESDGGGGEIMSETVGPKTLTYMTQARDNADTFYTRSAYGRLFLTIRNVRPRRGLGIAVYG